MINTRPELAVARNRRLTIHPHKFQFGRTAKPKAFCITTAVETPRCCASSRRWNERSTKLPELNGGSSDDAVSTGSGSDRVSIHATVEFGTTITRSLPLPVLTSLFNPSATMLRDGNSVRASYDNSDRPRQ